MFLIIQILWTFHVHIIILFITIPHVSGHVSCTCGLKTWSVSSSGWVYYVFWLCEVGGLWFCVVCCCMQFVLYGY